MARRDRPAPSETTRAKLREVRDRLYRKYGLDLTDAEKDKIAALLDNVVEAEAVEIASEFHVKPVVSVKFRVAVGSRVTVAKLLILVSGAIVLLGMLLVGAYLILNSPGAAALWK